MPMGESCQEIVENADQGPIPHGCGLPVRQGAREEIRMTPTVCVFNRTRESFLCLRAVAARVSGLRQGFRKVAREDGIWLMPSPSAYTVGTLFPVDRVYLDQGHRVIELVEHLDPLQIVPLRQHYASFLEVRTRTIYSSRTRVGDELLICSPEDVETHWKQIQEQVHGPIQAQRVWAVQEMISCSKD